MEISEQCIKLVKEMTDVSKDDYLKRIHRMVKFISNKEKLSKEDQIVARLCVFLPYLQEGKDKEELSTILLSKRNNVIDEIIKDAEILDLLSITQCTLKQFTLGSLLDFVSELKTATAKCIGASRLKIIKEFLLLEEIQNFGLDFNPECDLCFEKNINIGFLPCNHAFCSDCIMSEHGAVHCTICNKTFYDENKHDLWRNIVDFPKVIN